MIDQKLLADVLGITFPTPRPFGGVGDIHSHHMSGLLSFAIAPEYLPQLNENANIAGAFVSPENAARLSDSKIAVVVEDPKWAFFTLVDHIARHMVPQVPTQIASTAQIDPSAMIDKTNVTIADNVVIEPGVVIRSGTHIGEGAVIRPGAVLGVDGFQQQRTSKGIISVAHDGVLMVGKNVEIGPNNLLSKGFSYRPTIVGDNCKFDALVYYSHATQCGQGCFFGASAMVSGHVVIGENTTIGPGSNVSNRLKIGDNAWITIGAVVVQDVPDGERVTGNFAIPHARFIENLKKSVE